MKIFIETRTSYQRWT